MWSNIWIFLVTPTYEFCNMLVVKFGSPRPKIWASRYKFYNVFFFSLGKFMTSACRTPFGIVKTQLWTYLLPESFDAHIMFKVVCLAYPKGSIACAFRISNLEFKKRNSKFVAFLIQNSTCIERFWSQVCPELCF